MITKENLINLLANSDINASIDKSMEQDNASYICSIDFNNTLKQIHLFTKKKGDYSLLNIGFNNQPNDVNKISIPYTQFQLFINEFVLPGLKLPSIQDLAMKSWNPSTSKELLVIENNPNSKNDVKFIGMDKTEYFGNFHYKIIQSKFVTPIVVNEINDTEQSRSIAQYKTAFSGSYINYEGIEDVADGNLMSYYISYSYNPSSFGKDCLTSAVLKMGSTHYPDDMPLDLVLALDSLGLPYMLSMQDMVRKIIEGDEYPIVLVYILLIVRGLDGFMPYLPALMTFNNSMIKTYLGSVAKLPKYARLAQELKNYN